jgi:hypothetical protein
VEFSQHRCKEDQNGGDEEGELKTGLEDQTGGESQEKVKTEGQRVQRGDESSEKERVELTSMHCQPMVNRRRLPVYCKEKELSRKNLDVVFWGKGYIEGYECKGNVEFFLELGLRSGEKARKVKEKILYLNRLSKTLKHFFSDVRIYLASFAPGINLKKCEELCNRWILKCGDHDFHFKIITIEEFLSYLPI